MPLSNLRLGSAPQEKVSVKIGLFLLLVNLFISLGGRTQAREPLTLVQAISLPEVPSSPFADHLGIDLKGHRLFAAIPAKQVEMVIDLDAGRVVYNVPVDDPHAVIYRSDLDQIYITDDERGLRIFNGHDYKLIKSIDLLPRADEVGYDAATQFLYVDNGGQKAKLDYSLITVVDTTAGKRVADIKIPTEVPEQMALEKLGPLIYVNFRDKNQIGVVDRKKLSLLEIWPITKGKLNSAIALDETHHRLFVGCRKTAARSGAIVVFDTQGGKELQALPIGPFVDYMAFDPASGRLYSSTGAQIETYQQRDPDHYVLLGKTETGMMSKTGLLVPELHRYFALVPCLGTQEAQILVFETE